MFIIAMQTTFSCGSNESMRIGGKVAKPWVHSLSSQRRWGGEPDDYMEIHNLLDKSKGTIADSRHRVLTHTSWFLSEILERIFGSTFVNSAGRTVSVRDVGEQHVLEDYANRFIPSPQDFLEEMPMKEWMVAGKGEPPPSAKKIERKTTRRTLNLGD